MISDKNAYFRNATLARRSRSFFEQGVTTILRDCTSGWHGVNLDWWTTEGNAESKQWQAHK